MLNKQEDDTPGGRMVSVFKDENGIFSATHESTSEAEPPMSQERPENAICVN